MKYFALQSRFSAKVLWLALLVAAAISVTVEPCRLVAQQPAPTATAQPAPAASEPAKPEAAQTQEEQNESFLLDGPIVKWAANTFHIKTRTASNIFVFINFAIIALAIGIPLVKFMPKVLRKRSHTIAHSIEQARKVTEDADRRLGAIEAKLSGLDAEIAAIRAQVENESKQDEGRIKTAIEEERARIVASAEQEIAQAAAHAQRELRHFAADLAIEQAAKNLVLSAEADKALIAEFSATLADGGQK